MRTHSSIFNDGSGSIFVSVFRGVFLYIHLFPILNSIFFFRFLLIFFFGLSS